MNAMQRTIVLVVVASAGSGCTSKTAPVTMSLAPTSFFGALDAQQLFQTVSQKHDADLMGWGQSKGESRSVTIRRWTFFVRVTPAVQEDLMADFRRVVETQLKEAGCTIYGGGHGGNKPTDFDFSFEYLSQVTAGDIYVYATAYRDGYSLLVSVHEYISGEPPKSAQRKI